MDQKCGRIGFMSAEGKMSEQKLEVITVSAIRLNLTY